MLELSGERLGIDATAFGFGFKFHVARMQSIIHGKAPFMRLKSRQKGRGRLILDGATEKPITYDVALIKDPDIVSAEGRGLCDPDGIALGQRMRIVLEDGSGIRIRVRKVELDRIHFQSDHQQS
jgi:hypothetical protein